MSKKQGFSSFKDQQLIMESWRGYLSEEEEEVDEGIMDKLSALNPFNKLRNRSGGDSSGGEPAGSTDSDSGSGGSPGFDPSTSTGTAGDPADAPAPTASATPAAGSTGMPISGTEFATMNFLVGGQLLQIIKDAVVVGSAAKDKVSRNLQQLFNKEFFPALVKMTKNPNIDIAEGIDMEEFLQEMLIEAYGAEDAVREPLTRRQQSAKKGQKRASGGMQRYLSPMGTGKPPMIANKISRALTKALTQKANADSLFDAAAEVSATIKDPKAKAQYEKRYTDQLEKSPEKRVANYKQNVAAFVSSVSDLATKAAAKALGSTGNFDADKASKTADGRQSEEPGAPTDSPEAEFSTEPARRTGSSYGAQRLANMRGRNRQPTGIAGVTREGIDISESPKKWRVLKDGSVVQMVSENKKWKVLKDGSVIQVLNEKK